MGGRPWKQNCAGANFLPVVLLIGARSTIIKSLQLRQLEKLETEYAGKIEQRRRRPMNKDRRWPLAPRLRRTQSP